MTQHAFQAEVKQLLDLMIHSLYSEREIFLRELISNASDACDKLRFKGLTAPDLLKGDEELRITVMPDDEANTLVVEDNGIGMTAEEAVANLGTIARSGTREFVAAAGDGAKTTLAGLIGQFGVGFYAAFMVADRVVVETRAAGAPSEAGVRWESRGDGSFTTEAITRAQRGTTVTLHLKDDAKEFADRWRLHGLIKKHSDYVGHPIRLPKPSDQKKAEKAELEQVNAGKALWTRPKDEVTDEQYQEFYRGACKLWDEPATRLHFSVEGTLSFTSLLFIPSTRPPDLFDRQHHGLALYVRRVFIMDDCRDLLPEWLRFVRGVVDSDDLPLNVSREMLQQEQTVKRLRKVLVKRVLDHLDRLAASADATEQKAWATIDAEFGAVLREGIVTDFEQKDRLAGLARWRSTWTLDQPRAEGAAEVRTGLADYVKRMPAGQEHILFLTAPSLEAARSSPHLEGCRRRGHEVLLLCDPVDEWVANHLHEFDKKKLISIAKGEAEVDADEKKRLEEQTTAFKPFLDFCQGSLKGIKEVRLTGRLTDSPCCLVAGKDDVSAHFAELMRRMDREAPTLERILELNPAHPLVAGLQRLHGEKADDPRLPAYVGVLRDQAVLAEGGQLADPAGFAKRVQDLMAAALGGAR